MANDNNRGAVGRLLKGNLLILIATIFFGVNVPIVKVLVPEWMNAMDVSAVRMFGGCVLMWLVSLFMKNDTIQKRHWRNIILGGSVGLFFFIFLFNLSIRFSNPIDVSIIMTMPPAFVVLINMLFKGNRPSRLETFGLILSFVGAFIVITMQHGGGERGTFVILGDLLALASSVCYAYYLVVLEEPMKIYKPVSLLRWVYLVASVPTLFLLPGLLHAHLWHTSDPEPWLMIAFVLICPTFLSYFLMAPAMKLLSSELVSIYQYLVPVFAAIASVILGVGSLHPVQIIAMLVIIGGMAMSNVGKFRRNKAHIAAMKAHGIDAPSDFIKDVTPMVEDVETSVEHLSKLSKELRNAASEETLSAPRLYDAATQIIDEASEVSATAGKLKNYTSTHL